MGQLRDKQVLFTSCLGRFLTFASENNYELTLGEAYRPDRKGHMPNSLHYERLAIDLNLFVDGKYIKNGDHPAWKALGLYWEGLHPLCRWGGRFNDANHLSIAHGGRA